jgi:hypothetical protein
VWLVLLCALPTTTHILPLWALLARPTVPTVPRPVVERTGKARVGGASVDQRRMARLSAFLWLW